MTEPGKANHWDDLAEELGADARPFESEPVTEKPAAVEPASVADPVKKPRRPPQRQSSPTDWGSVASELGVVPTTESESQPEEFTDEAVDKVTDEVVDSAVHVEEVVETDDDYDDLGFESDIAFECDVFAGGPSVEVESPEPTPLTELTGETRKSEPADSEGESDTAVEAEEESPARKGRRRRRRRRSGRKGDDDANSTEADEGVTVSQAGVTSVTLDETETTEATVAVPAPDQEEADQKASPRPKRKRRRRGGRKTAKRETETDDVAQPADDQDASIADLEAESPEQLADTEDDESEEGRGKHRGIPSWEEAVGVIIEANLAARAKKPSSGSTSTRGRGRRGRGTSPGK